MPSINPLQNPLFLKQMEANNPGRLSPFPDPEPASNIKSSPIPRSTYNQTPPASNIKSSPIPRSTFNQTSKVARFAKKFPWKIMGYSAALGLTLSATCVTCAGLAVICPSVLSVAVIITAISGAVLAGGTLSLFLAYKIYKTAFSNNTPFPQPKPVENPSPLSPGDDKTPPPPLPPRDKEVPPPPPPLPPRNEDAPAPLLSRTVNPQPNGKTTGNTPSEFNPAKVIGVRMEDLARTNCAFQQLREDEENFQEELQDSPTEDFEWDLD